MFLVLRAINVYGDPAPWKAFPDAARTVMSFFNVSKYPPSLLFVSITLGVSLLCLLAFQRLRGVLARVLLAYGRTPLFTYVLHIYVVHGASLVVAVLASYPAAYHVNFLRDPFRPLQGRLRLQPRGRLPRVAGNTRRTVSGGALVRGGEAAAARLVVELYVGFVMPN